MTETELRGALDEAQRQAETARATEALLRESEFRVRVLLDVASDASASFDEKMDRLLRIGCRQFGLQHAFVMDASVSAMPPEYQSLHTVSLVDDRETAAEPAAPLREQLCEHIFSKEARFFTADTSVIGSSIATGDGVLGCVVFYGSASPAKAFSLAEQEFVDLLAQWIGSEMSRQHAEAALANTQERYELAVRGSKDGLWDWDITNNRVINSPRWKQMLGYDEQELPDDTGVWDALLHPDDQAFAFDALNDYLAGRTSEYEIEYRMRHKDGSYRWVLARGFALRDADGIAYRMAGSHSDITIRKNAEEALRESETALAEAQKVAQIGSWRLDITSRRYLWSKQLYLLYGFDPEQPLPPPGGDTAPRPPGGSGDDCRNGGSLYRAARNAVPALPDPSGG
jgi:PAS domain S-box-containing protein